MTLATELLPLAKQQMNVTFNDDDTLITTHLNWAISFCQNESGWIINGGNMPWTPVPAGTLAKSKYPVPYRPVSTFVVTSGGVDVSAEYELATGDTRISPLYLVHKDGTPFPADASVLLTVGYTNPDTMPPEFQAAILRMTSALYENRGSITSISLDTVPHWFRDLLQGVWVPRA
jgi:hypothetical protein